VPTYQYVAVDAGRRRVRGSVDAPGERAALTELERRKLTPVEITERRERAGGSSRVSGVALARAYSQLGDLLRAGVPLLRSLRLLAGRKSTQHLSAIFGELADAVEDGEELAEAMARHPEVFRDTHVAIVRAGERGAFLEQALGRLARLVERHVELRQKVLGSLIYPSFIVVFGGSRLLGLLVTVRLRGTFPPVDRRRLAHPDKCPARSVERSAVLSH